MRAYELLKESGYTWSVTLKDTWTQDAEEDFPEVQNWEYDVRLNGKVVGSIQYDDYFGNMLADFGARGVEISRYADTGVDYINDMERYVLSAVSSYFNSKTGQKHFEVMARQQSLKEQPPEKEEIEEIKVTKTLAGKRTKPSRDLAMKAKMTKKKKDSKGKVVKDASTPMNRNVHDLANITLKGEYRS